MFKKINFLRTLPKVKTKIVRQRPKKIKKHIIISRKFGRDYFDGNRAYGYGGYKYDGRWATVAKDIIKTFKLKKNSMILDIGCAKGFLVKEFVNLGMDAYGIDISEYALKKAVKEVSPRLHYGNAKKLPFHDNIFDCVISINTIHNLPKFQCRLALKEIMRVSKGFKNYVQVDSYLNKKQKKNFLNWVLTAKYHDYPKGWKKLFKECNYQGFYNWTTV